MYKVIVRHFGKNGEQKEKKIVFNTLKEFEKKIENLDLYYVVVVNAKTHKYFGEYMDNVGWGDYGYSINFLL